MANSTDSSSDRNSPVHHGTFSPADNGATSQGSDLLLFGTVLGAILSLVGMLCRSPVDMGSEAPWANFETGNSLYLQALVS